VTKVAMDMVRPLRPRGGGMIYLLYADRGE
jgi:hypothetical protein